MEKQGQLTRTEIIEEVPMLIETASSHELSMLRSMRHTIQSQTPNLTQAKIHTVIDSPESCTKTCRFPHPALIFWRNLITGTGFFKHGYNLIMSFAMFFASAWPPSPYIIAEIVPAGSVLIASSNRSPSRIISFQQSLLPILRHWSPRVCFE